MKMARWGDAGKGKRCAILRLLLLVFIIVCPESRVCFSSLVDPAQEWHLLYIRIRDGLISRQEAQSRVKSLDEMLRQFYPRATEGEKEKVLCFPLEGYGPSAIGGKAGSGYKIQGYDFFDGNRHKGHPGHDIFIRDKNQDGLDDATGKPVNVVSAASGVVVSVNSGWEVSSPVRGGNYVWIYEPGKGRYYYYAHLNEIFVRIGQGVGRGEPIGTVGRTGKNAYGKRSPTHLHLAVLESIDGYPRPVNPYDEWIRK